MITAEKAEVLIRTDRLDDTHSTLSRPTDGSVNILLGYLQPLHLLTYPGHRTAGNLDWAKDDLTISHMDIKEISFGNSFDDRPRQFYLIVCRLFRNHVLTITVNKFGPKLDHPKEYFEDACKVVRIFRSGRHEFKGLSNRDLTNPDGQRRSIMTALETIRRATPGSAISA